MDMRLSSTGLPESCPLPLVCNLLLKAATSRLEHVNVRKIFKGKWFSTSHFFKMNSSIRAMILKYLYVAIIPCISRTWYWYCYLIMRRYLHNTIWTCFVVRSTSFSSSISSLPFQYKKFWTVLLLKSSTSYGSLAIKLKKKYEISCYWWNTVSVSWNLETVVVFWSP